MSGRKVKPNNKGYKSIEKAAKAMFEKAEARRKAGRNSLDAGWQAALETMLLLMEGHLREHPGQLLPMNIRGQEEWEFYQGIQEKLDLPPDTCAVLVTPSAFEDTPLPEAESIELPVPGSWKRKAYSVIVSGCRDHTVVMQASLPGVESVGVDVFEDGNHFADYTYNTIEECLDDLASVTWTYFKPKGAWAMSR